MKRVQLKGAGCKNYFVFLDYDGTIVPIKKRPELAILGPDKKRILSRLGKRVSLCLVSGRSLRELKALARVRGIGYIGNHGLEMSYGNRKWIHPEAERTRDSLRAALNKIRIRLRSFSGVLVENKGLTGSIHVRRTPAILHPEIFRIVEEEILPRRRFLKLTEGKKVIEVRPNVNWDKGKGILKMRGWLAERPRLQIYIGDDRTDEDAFRKMRKNDWSILVGKERVSNARFRVDGVAQVWGLLETLSAGAVLWAPQSRKRRVDSH
jgi:trehalose-phosphatase